MGPSATSGASWQSTTVFGNILLAVLDAGGPVNEVMAAMAVDPLEIGCALPAEFNVA
jgi:hypothetical protein